MLIQLLVIRRMLRSLEEAAKDDPRQFSCTTFLNREDAYEETQVLPHLCAARRFVKEYGCAWPGERRVSTIQLKPTTSAKGTGPISNHCYFYEHFLKIRGKVDVGHYVKNVKNRFAALLKFTIPDVEARFDKAIRTISRSGDGASIYDLLGVATVAPTNMAAFTGSVNMDTLPTLKACIHNVRADDKINDRSGALAFKASFPQFKDGSVPSIKQKGGGASGTRKKIEKRASSSETTEERAKRKRIEHQQLAREVADQPRMRAKRKRPVAKVAKPSAAQHTLLDMFACK